MSFISKSYHFFSTFLQRFSQKMKVTEMKHSSDWIFIYGEKILIKLEKLIPIYLKFYEDIIDAEITLANITKNDTVLHIGSGSIPASSLLIHKKTKAKIIGIDTNIKTIHESKKFEEVKNGKITVQHVYSQKYPLDQYDVILIAQGVEPRKEILTNIANQINQNTRVIYRTISNSSQNLTSMDTFLKEIFTIVTIKPHPKHGFLISVLLKKKKNLIT